MTLSLAVARTLLPNTSFTTDVCKRNNRRTLLHHHHEYEARVPGSLESLLHRNPTPDLTSPTYHLQQIES